MRLARQLAFALSMTFLPAGVHAQLSEGGLIELGALASYHRFDQQSLGLAADYGVGARAALFLSRWLSVEGGVARALTHHPALPRGVAMTELSAGVLANIRAGGLNQVFIGGGYSRLLYTGSLDFDDHAVHAVLGDRIPLSRMSALRVEGRALYAPTTNSPGAAGRTLTFSISAGISIFMKERPPRDEDSDLVPDRFDRCPMTPAGAIVDATGCPRDTDRDGVLDGLDRCAGTPLGVSVDPAGCALDRDGDGVPDFRDACPGTVDGVAVGEDGCAPDTDGDGVRDDADRCPATPAGAPIDADGCLLDTDADGVPDYLDRCAMTPQDQQVDAIGCPVLFEEREGERQPLVLRGVNFELDEAVLTPESFAVLEQVGASLVANSEVIVEVSGHTDATGEAARNQALSLARAEAVRDFLISRGVEPERLIARGYGSDQPVASNATEEGRAANRRVELRLVEN